MIISDALRYEVASELSERIVRTTKGTAELMSMQAFFPSITKFGMAALLPAKSISVNDSMDVLVDGNPTRSTVERNAILNATPKASVAIQYNDLLNMKKDERRELVAGKDVIYIYHMVFVGNINQSVDVLLKTSSLFDPFPPEMGTDTAFLDRMHCYIPGWEIPKFRPEHFTNDYGFITDYLAEFIRELRKEQYGDALDKYFRLGKNLNQRDTIAVRKMVGGMIKLLYQDGVFTKEQLEEILKFALEMRRRVKEQLKKLGGMEFYDVNFSYIDNDTFEEHFASVPEQGGGKLIPEGMCNPGQVYTVSRGKSGMIGVFRLESQMLPGNGKFERTGLNSDGKCKEAANTAFNYLKANGNRISGAISTTTKDYIINYQDLQGIGMTEKLALPTLIALCSIALGKPTLSSLAVLGEISIAGTMLKVDELANALQVCLDSGAKKVLLPITSAADLGLVPADLIGCFNLVFYQSAEDAVYKALGVE